MLNSIIEILPEALFVLVKIAEKAEGNQNGVLLGELLRVTSFKFIQPDVVLLVAASIFQTLPAGTICDIFRLLLL
jgi:hypothetical protein